MSKLFQNINLKKAFGATRPWLMMVALFLVLRYTGAIAGLSFLANQALMTTGAMDADPGDLVTDKDFEYDFSLKNAAGERIPFAEFKNKTVFLNIWATWCGPCRVEMPSIQSLYNSVDHDKIVFIMLSVDDPGHLEKITRFVKEKGYTFPVFTPDGYLPKSLRVPTIPTTFVISPAGKIVSKKVGAANYDTPEFKKFLEGL